MALRFIPSPSMAVSMLALVISLGGAAVAANGGMFTLGKGNSASRATVLTANRNGPSLTLRNDSTATSATALNLRVKPSKPPMKVNSKKKVANLNADLLDGYSSGSFQRITAYAEPRAYAHTIPAESTLYYFPIESPEFTSSERQVCEVDGAAQITINPTTVLGPIFELAKLHNGQPTVSEFVGYHYFTATESTRSTVVARKASFLVEAGETVKFGVYFSVVQAAWQNKQVVFDMSYRCFATM